MINRMLASILCLSLVLCVFVGCNKQNENPEDITEETVIETTTEPVKQEPERLLDIDFSSKDIRKMSNYMNGEYYVSDGVWTAFGYNRIDNKSGLSTSKSGSEGGILFEKYGTHINIINEWIYCLARSRSSKKWNLVKIRISGSGEKTIVEPKKDYSVGGMMIHESKIYYLEYPIDNSAGSALYCCDLDGKNKKTIIDKNIYDYYIVGDTILYTDYETMRLYTCSISGENEELLIDDWVMDFIYDGSELFYMSFKEDMTREKYKQLDDFYKCVIKCTSSKNEKGKIIVSNASSFSDLAIDDDYVYYGNYDDSSRLYRMTKDGKKTMLI